MELFVAHNGQQTGPFNETQLREMLASGAVSGTDLAWHQGLSGWQPLNTLVSAPGATTPAPVPAPAPAAAPPAYAPPAYQQPPGGMPPSYMQPPAYAYPQGAGGMIDTSNLAGLGARLGGAIIDGIFAGICVGPGYGIMIAGAVRASQSGDQNPSLTGSGLGLGLMLLGFLVVLVVQAFLLSTTGQSIGKKIVGTRIVKLDNAPAGFVGAFLLRFLVGQLLPNCIPIINFFYGIVDICFIFRADHRCLHDLIAGTKVVRA